LRHTKSLRFSFFFFSFLVLASAGWDSILVVIFFVAGQKAFFRDQKLFFKEVCGQLMQGRKRANYAGKWSKHGAK
jgi:hypothetical protein